MADSRITIMSFERCRELMREREERLLQALPPELQSLHLQVEETRKEAVSLIVKKNRLRITEPESNQLLRCEAAAESKKQEWFELERQYVEECLAHRLAGVPETRLDDARRLLAEEKRALEESSRRESDAPHSAGAMFGTYLRQRKLLEQAESEHDSEAIGRLRPVVESAERAVERHFEEVLAVMEEQEQIRQAYEERLAKLAADHGS